MIKTLETFEPFIPEDSRDKLLSERELQAILGIDVLKLLDFDSLNLNDQPPFSEMIPFGPMQRTEDLPERRGPAMPRSSGVVWTADPDNSGKGSWDRDNDAEGD